MIFCFVVPLCLAHVVLVVAFSVFVLTVATVFAVVAPATPVHFESSPVVLTTSFPNTAGLPEFCLAQLTLDAAPDGPATEMTPNVPTASAVATNSGSGLLRPMLLCPP